MATKRSTTKKKVACKAKSRKRQPVSKMNTARKKLKPGGAKGKY